ncbi:hypothetical protein GCM10009847_17310 [Leucobacter tardus]
MNGTEISGSAPNGGASTFSLSPSSHLHCMVYGEVKRQIGKYPVKRNGSFSGKVKLLCGNGDV